MKTRTSEADLVIQINDDECLDNKVDNQVFSNNKSKAWIYAKMKGFRSC